MSTKHLFFIDSLDELYTEVQSSDLFEDSKHFVDSIPNSSIEEILNCFKHEKGKPGFNLALFVATHFTMPPEADNHYHSNHKTILVHLNELWDVLQRNPDKDSGTLIPLPYPYIVPGGRFREIYYWDSYFTMLGLKVSNRIEIIENMLNNFAYLIDKFGFIPNGNRTYYLSRSQPPFFALMVELLASIQGDTVLLKYAEELEKEYAFWMDGAPLLNDQNPVYRRAVRLPDGTIVSRYFDDKTKPRPEAYLEDLHLSGKTTRQPEVLYRNIRAAAESGWDFSSRWFKDEKNMHTIQTTDLIPVDLNALLVYVEQTLAKINTLQGKTVEANTFIQKAEARKKAIETYCWNKEKNFYFDYNFRENTNTNTYSLAAAYPLFFSIAPEKNAAAVKQCIMEQFLKVGGVITTINHTRQQWDAPNGWAPLQWITYKALMNYQFTEEAGLLKQRWIAANESIYTETEKMMEKYNVADTDIKAGGGEYPNQDGFGWTNGVYLAMKAE